MFKITTYPNGALNVKTTDPEALRAHKADRGKFCLQGQIEEFSNLKDLVHRAAQVPITPSEMKDGRRAKVNFIQTSILVLDVDSGIDLMSCQLELDATGYEFAIYTSYSHQTWGEDKFHVIMPTATPITTEEDYKATYNSIASSVFRNNNDAQTCSPVNLFFNSNVDTVEIFLNHSTEDLRRVEVVKVAVPKKIPNNAVVVTPTNESEQSKLSKLSKRTLLFLQSGAAEGEWHTNRNLAVKNLKAAGFTRQECEDKLRKITGHLSDADTYQIDYCYTDKNWNYDTTMINNMHPLKAKYTDQKGRLQTIPDQEIVAAFSAEKFLTISLDGQFYLEGHKRDVDYVLEEIRNYAQTIMGKNVSFQVIGSILNKLSTDKRQVRFEEMKAYIAFKSDATFDFNKLIEAVGGVPNELEATVLKHFVWQVKRKIYGLPVSYHNMPVLVGKSGSGKSQLIKKMLHPIHEMVYYDGDFKKLVDTREAFNLISYFVYFIDEMSKAETADVESIKNKITSDKIQYRKLGTNVNAVGDNHSTFIGASNLNLQYVIKDATSVRRFFQINTLDKMNWELVNSFDYLEMWQSIDENQSETFIKPMFEAFETAQQTFKYQTPLEHFIIEERLTANKDDSFQKVSRVNLYKLFCTWAIENGYRYGISKHAFCDSLKNLVGPVATGRVDGKYTEFYYINNKQVDDESKH
jgi:hypothetical protein